MSGLYSGCQIDLAKMTYPTLMFVVDGVLKESITKVTLLGVAFKMCTDSTPFQSFVLNEDLFAKIVACPQRYVLMATGNS